MYEAIHVSKDDKIMSIWSCSETEITGVWYTKDHNPHFSVQAVILCSQCSRFKRRTSILPNNHTKWLGDLSSFPHPLERKDTTGGCCAFSLFSHPSVSCFVARENHHLALSSKKCKADLIWQELTWVKIARVSHLLHAKMVAPWKY